MSDYSIGIDLGTTNCALAYVRASGTPSEVLPIPQWAGPERRLERTTLPSFLYRPVVSERGAYGNDESDWVVGLAAREQTRRTPGRVAHSAKSWLANHRSDLSAALLPWQSEVLPAEERISPLDASAVLLAHLREAWEAAFPDAPLAAQTVTLTVPASFDAAAQGATLEAAERAGFPAAVRLLEEPQAAFYRWLEAAGEPSASLRAGEQVLVVDVGGGTSDFSLFRVTEMGQGRGATSIERLAVSEHILLGGDNIDLALAHFLEAQLVSGEGQIEGESWNHLVARARDLKERALASENEVTLRLAVPGQGSGLLAGTLSAEVSAGELREIVLEGFFPFCGRQERPSEARSALQEWGLPYAADFAVTRYLADFLREHPPVDAVLFNGGSLASARLRERLVEQLARWQQGHAPRVLANPEPDLAVARGAAAYGALGEASARPIEAGAARAVFLEVATAGPGEPRRLLCVLPRGAPPEERCRAALEGLQVRVNQPVAFAAFQGAHRRADQAGALVEWNEDDFTALPSLGATIDWIEEGEGAVPVELESRLNELGLLQVELRTAAPAPSRSWPLAFDLRLASKGPSGSDLAETAAPIFAVDEARVEKARVVLERAFAAEGGRKGGRPTPARVLQAIERVLEEPKAEWPLPVVRRLADQLLERAAGRTQSPAHAETWLYLAGWLLRPGFGDPGDATRLDRLWSLLAPDRFPPARRTEPAYSLLWRRLAGGLGAERQEALYTSRRDLWLDPKRAPAEGVRLAGALERLDLTRKRELFEAFLTRAEALGREAAHPAPYLAALGGLLGRTPLRAGSAVTVPPAWVEEAWERLKPFDWSAPHMAAVRPLFLRAARQTDDPALNLGGRAARRIADRLEKTGLSPQSTEPLRRFVPLAPAQTAELYEDALPPGLVLG